MCCGGPSNLRNAKKYEKKDSKLTQQKPASRTSKPPGVKPSGSGKRRAPEASASTPVVTPAPKKPKRGKNKTKK